MTRSLDCDCNCDYLPIYEVGQEVLILSQARPGRDIMQTFLPRCCSSAFSGGGWAEYPGTC